MECYTITLFERKDFYTFKLFSIVFRFIQLSRYIIHSVHSMTVQYSNVAHWTPHHDLKVYSIFHSTDPINSRSLCHTCYFAHTSTTGN